jgi:hypothetical protein
METDNRERGLQSALPMQRDLAKRVRGVTLQELNIDERNTSSIGPHSKVVYDSTLVLVNVVETRIPDDASRQDGQ